MKKLYLLRHGQTEFNVKKLVQGRCDSPLTDLGRRQAGMAAAQNLISGTLGFNPFNVPDDQVVDANGVLNPNATFMWADDTDWESNYTFIY